MDNYLHFSKRKRIVLLTFLLFTSLFSVAQQKLTVAGKLLYGTESEPAAFTTVSLLHPETKKIIVGQVTDKNGVFNIQTDYSGKFIIQVTSIGFKKYESVPFEGKVGEKMEIPAIKLEEEITSLKEVSVKATRPNVIIEADKTIVTVEGTVMAQGNNALDIVGRSPGIFIDTDGNINLNGRAGATVLINDRQTYMSRQELINFLRGMPAENIKSIEIISTPGARYDAEGTAGMINIKLKSASKVDGTSGSISVGTQYNGQLGNLVGGTVNVKKKKLVFAGNLNYNEGRQLVTQDMRRNFFSATETAVFQQISENNITRKNLVFLGAADYELNKNHSIGINMQLSAQNSSNKRSSLGNITSNKTTDHNNQLTRLTNSTDNNRAFLNLHYSGTLDSAGSRLSADIDFTKMNGFGNEVLDNRYWLNQDANNYTTDKIRNITDLDFNILTAKVDYVKVLSKTRTLEAGLKGSYVYTDNDLQLSRSSGTGPFTADPGSNHFIYDEKVAAAYATFKDVLSKKLNYQAGLRVEYSDIVGNSVTLNKATPQQYLNLFPTLFLQHKVSDNYQVNYSFTRRINRPNYNQLNPFIVYLDPLTSNQGNPNLKPQFSYNFEVSHVFKKTSQIALGYSRIEDLFQRALEQDAAARTTRSIPVNLDHSQNFNLRFLLPKALSKKWNTSNTLQFNYNVYKSFIGKEYLDVNQFSYFGRSQHNFVLPGNFKLEVTGFYQGPQRSGQFLIESQGWVDMGLTRSFKKDKLSLSLNGSDVFRTQKARFKVQFSDIDTRAIQYFSNQTVRFTARYNFQKGKAFKTQNSNRSGSAEERDRMN
jgi:hypothetical protein